MKPAHSLIYPLFTYIFVYLELIFPDCEPNPYQGGGSDGKNQEVPIVRNPLLK